MVKRIFWQVVLKKEWRRGLEKRMEKSMEKKGF
jgi:hypothetical protein